MYTYIIAVVLWHIHAVKQGLMLLTINTYTIHVPVVFRTNGIVNVTPKNKYRHSVHIQV